MFQRYAGLLCQIGRGEGQAAWGAGVVMSVSISGVNQPRAAIRESVVPSFPGEDRKSQFLAVAQMPTPRAFFCIRVKKLSLWCDQRRR